MKGKSPQSSTRENKATKKVSFEEYFSYFNFKRNPVSKAQKDMMFEDYLNWAKNDNQALCCDDFPLDRGIPLWTWYKWIKADPDYGLIHAQVKRFVGNRREKLAFMNKANASIFMTSAPHYDYQGPDKTWKELLEQKAALNEASSAKSAIYLVEDEARRTPEQVAGEVHAKTKKYVKPKYKSRVEEQDEDKFSHLM